ncbi:uncharacterized protein RAG0_16826 [Rhynchosporium agropyri]|uniref:Uncharacterized protein n=1 Tax=Rhynchosporium agropyri TaxID=914238 RepID=A0A1E1LS20_9HELO|nr:uncharacterized protein RAG0_16826 [Rhynchosporium agropyri]
MGFSFLAFDHDSLETRRGYRTEDSKPCIEKKFERLTVKYHVLTVKFIVIVNGATTTYPPIVSLF